MTSKKTASSTSRKDLSNNSASPQTMEELLAQAGGLQPGLKRGQMVSGTIVALSPKEILVDIGAKSEGIVNGKELAGIGAFVSQLSIGETVKAQVAAVENEVGQVVLSLRSLSETRAWEDLEEKRRDKTHVVVSGVEAVRGGLLVEVPISGGGTLRGFLPASQMASNRLSHVAESVGIPITVQILELDQYGNRLVVSEKAAMSVADREKITKRLAQFTIGQVVSAQVSAIAPFGLFVTVSEDDATTKEQVEGLIHISEVAWEKVDDLPGRFTLGDSLKAQVITIDEAQGRLNLSIRLLQENPWEEIAAHFPVSTKVTGQIARLTPFGVFVTIAPGIEGLLHSSKLPAGYSVQIGENVDCEVESIDAGKRRIGLSLVLKEKPVTYR